MKSLVSFFINLNRNGKILLISFFDFFLMLCSVYIAFILFNDRIVTFSTGPQISFLVSIFLYFLFSYFFKTYNAIHSYFNYRDALDIFKAIFASGFTMFLVGILFNIKYFFF